MDGYVIIWELVVVDLWLGVFAEFILRFVGIRLLNT